MNRSIKSRRISGGILSIVFLFTLNLGFAFSQTYKIMPLGNSLTKGIIIDDPGDLSGYRDDFQLLLDAEQVAYDFVGSQQSGGFADNEHEGHEGFTADMVRDNLSGWLAVNPDIVVVHVGTNDITLEQRVDSTVSEITNIVEQIGPNKKILLCSLLPRWDDSAKDDSTALLNSWIKNIYYSKLGDGYKIYYVGINEVFKSNADWASATYFSDGVHPSAIGYNLMARTIYVSAMNAIKGNDPTVTDNFNRSTLGVTWKADPEYAIQNKELENTAEHDWWDYIATYVGITNANQVSMKWGVDADSVGVVKGGIVMGMDAPDPDADGYLIWRYGNNLTLYEIRNGEPFSNPPSGHIYQIAAQQPLPQAGDVFKVVMRIENDRHVFDCFINGQPDGTLLDFGKLHGASGRFYSGIMLKGHEGEPYFNNVDDFTIYGQDDIEPPARITNLVVSEYTTTTATLKWTAPGDDEMEGNATGYDIRYSTELITETNFYDAVLVANPPVPTLAGTQEIFVVTGLQSTTTYFFAVKAYDDVPNFSLVSNSPSITTKESNILVDNFNRLELGENWNADPEFGIVNDELANTTVEEGWNYIAAFNARANPTEVSFKWSESADINGIEQGGLALMLNSASPNASGYLAWCRPNSKKISLFTIENGEATTPLGEKAIDPAKIPQPGSIFKVAMITDELGHHFIYYVNGDKVGEIIDGPTPLQGTASTLYAGIMLHGNRNNNLDNFTIVNVGGEPTRLNYIVGNFQEGVVGQILPDSLVVSVTDMNSIPVENVLVKFKVTDGLGRVNLEPPDDNIRVEAENGDLAGTFKRGEDVMAGGGSFVYNDGGDPLSGKLDLDFFVENEGNYNVWGRAKASQGGFNYYSYFVQIDGEPAISTSEYSGVWDFFPTTDSWTWDKVSERGNGTPKNPSVDPVEFFLTTGLHRITITQRYPSFCELDKVLLTLIDSGYVPTGKEEFPEYITNSRGEASAALTLGFVAGTENNSVEVTVPGYDLLNEPFVFKASGLPDVPTLMNASSATTQTGKGGNPLASPFEVSLTDQYGNIASGYDVLFKITVGNGVLSNGEQEHTVTTDALGKASTVLSLGTESEQNEVQATFPGLSPVTFTGIATSGLAEQMLPVSGSGLSGTVNAVLATPLSVRIVDNIGDPVAKHPVKFLITEGGGSISLVTAFQEMNIRDKKDERIGASPEDKIESLVSELIVSSDAEGYAQVNLKLGTTSGINTVTVTSEKSGENLDGSPIVYSATGIADVPSMLHEVSGNNQTGAASMPLIDPFVVKVTDQYGNPVSGHVVTYDIKQGSGSLDPAGPWFSESSGEVRVKLTLGNDEGVTNIVEASSEYDGTPLASTVVFQATAGSVSEIELSGSQSFTGSAGWPLNDSLKVKVLDNFGNPVGGYPIFWESTGENPGTINGEYQTIVLSDRNGISKVGFFASPVPGQVLQVNARADGLTGSPIIFDINIANVDALQRITGNFQSGTVGSSLPLPFKVKVIDELNRAVPGFKVTFDVTGGNGSFAGDSTVDVITNENKEAEALLTLGPVPGVNNNRVEVSAFRKGKELLEHGNLDEWGATTPIGWSVWKSDPAIDVRQEVANARSGKAVRFSLGSNGGAADIFVNGDINIKPNAVYEFSFWVRGAIAGKNIKGYLKDNTNLYLKEDGTWTTQENSCISVNTTTSYAKQTIKFTTQNNASTIPKTGLIIYVLGNNNICYVDDVSLVEVESEGDQHIAGSPLTFSASAQIGPADSLIYVQGDSQYVVVGNPLENPLGIEVRDKCGNKIVNHPVTFEVMQGGGYLDGVNTQKLVSKTTDQNGMAQVELTVGTIKGEYNNIVEVRADRPTGGFLDNAPFRFYASARPSDADQLTKVTDQNPQNPSVRQKLLYPYVVKVADRQGNGVEDHPVQFLVKTGNGTFDTIDGDSVKTVQTDNMGESSVYYYPGPKAGELNIIEVRSWNGAPELNGSPVTFTSTPAQGPVSATASRITATGPVLADAQSQSFITITLTDAFGNPIQGKAIVLNVTGSNNFITQPITLTDANGRTTGSLASTRAEMKTVTAYDVTDGVQITSSAQVEFVSLEAAYISSRAGSNQQGNYNTALKTPLTALVTDKNGNPVYYHPVYFEAYQGNGLIFDMNKNRVYEGQPVFSDESGVASVYWVMGPSSEVNRARVTSTNLSGSGEYIATAQPGQAASFYKSSGTNQLGTAGHVLTEPLACKVTDANGDAIYNHAVKYRITFGGGSFDNMSEITLATDHFGEATVNLTLGREAGINTVEASSVGLSGSPQYFTATGQSGDAAKMVKVSGDGFFGAVGTTITGITIAVTDIYDNVFRGGYDILFSIISGNATISGSQTVSTDVNGQASVSIHLGTTTGDVIVQAYAAGLINNPLKFMVKAKAASPVSMSIFNGDNQQGTIGRELVYPFEVKVIDSYNNPVDNVGISFVKTGGSGSLLTPQLIYTNEEGLAQARLRLGSELGTYQIMAVKNGLSGSPLYFDATGVTNNFPLFQGLNTQISSPENQVVSFTLNASDNDLDPLSYSAEGLPQGATFDALSTRRFSWTPNFTRSGEYKIHFIVRDNKGGLDDEIVNIDVTNFNRLPQITSYQPVQQFLTGHKDIGETFYFSITVSDQDPDDEITYQWFYDDLLVSTNANYSLYVNSNNINLGVHGITAKVTDGHDTVERSWEVTVKTPVELISFSAEPNSREGVILRWQTGYESNNAGFNILRSQTINGTYNEVNDDLIPSDSEREYEYNDTDVRVGSTYYYKLEDVSINGKRTEHEIVKINITRPEKFELSQNFPNPFNPVTKIYFQLPDPIRVVLKVYNLLGQEVITLMDQDMEAGYHTTHWRGTDQFGNQLSSGVYYYRMTAGSFSQAKKMVLIR